MASAWLLPEHIADVLPARARHIEALRRGLLDTAAGFGFELVIPPMLEHIESLLSGTGHALDLQTFKLVDQLSGRTLGLRADSTPQAARIDAHMLNRSGVVRLCYCGPVLHARPSGSGATREPLQFGAEIYGHAGAGRRSRDHRTGARVPRRRRHRRHRPRSGRRAHRSRRAGRRAGRRRAARRRLRGRSLPRTAPRSAAISKDFPAAARRGLDALVDLYGDEAVLDEAARVLPERPLVATALAELRRLAAHARQAQPRAQVELRPCRLERLRLLQRRPLRGLCARRERCDRPRRPLRRGRRGLRPQPSGRRLRPRRQGPRRCCRRRRPRPPRSARPCADDASLRATVRAMRTRGEVVVADLDGAGAAASASPARRLVDEGGRWIVAER